MKRKVDRLDELTHTRPSQDFLFLIGFACFNISRHKRQINFPKVQSKTSGEVCTVEANNKDNNFSIVSRNFTFLYSFKYLTIIF